MEPRQCCFDAPTLDFAPHESGIPQPRGTHRIAYTEWGNPNNPNILVCVHGLSRNGRDFDFFARDLATHYRVICPDMVGRGKSDWLNNKLLYGYPLYIADCVALLASLEVDYVDWVGTSMGGVIGMVIAGSHPGLIRKLVLNDIGPLVSKVGLQRITGYVGQQTGFPTREALEKYLKKIMQPFGINHGSFWQHIIDHSAVRNANGGYDLAYDPAIAMAFQDTKVAIEDVDMWPLWAGVNNPVLVIRGGESDILRRDTVEIMRTSRSGVDSVEWAGIGHAPMLMDEYQIEFVGEWLMRP